MENIRRAQCTLPFCWLRFWQPMAALNDTPGRTLHGVCRRLRSSPLPHPQFGGPLLSHWLANPATASCAASASACARSMTGSARPDRRRGPCPTTALLRSALVCRAESAAPLTPARSSEVSVLYHTSGMLCNLCSTVGQPAALLYELISSLLVATDGRWREGAGRRRGVCPGQCLRRVLEHRAGECRRTILIHRPRGDIHGRAPSGGLDVAAAQQL